jgi:hypothetical protein
MIQSAKLAHKRGLQSMIAQYGSGSVEQAMMVNFHNKLTKEKKVNYGSRNTPDGDANGTIWLP